jgi:uncharacterized protein (TIGR03437 family)
MDRQRRIFIGKTVAILSAIPVIIWAHAEGPDPGHAGVPGEYTCAQLGCHIGTPLNGGGGSVTINAGGTTYTPGVAQQISVSVADPKQRRWGFQLTARSASDPTSQQGTFTPGGGDTQVTCSTEKQLSIDPSNWLTCGASAPLEYIEHTLLGAVFTATGAGHTWTFSWTPPASATGSIILYAAGNAANGDSEPTGDHIYTTTVTLTSGSGGGGSAPNITDVQNGGSFTEGFAANTWVTIKGSGLASDTRIWKGSDFTGPQGNMLPTNLDGTSVMINNKPAFVYYISPTQVNVLSPVDSATGPVTVQLTYNGAASNSMTSQKSAVSPAFFTFNGMYIAATHANGSFLGPTSLYAGSTTPAAPGETITLYGTGFGPTTPAIVNGQVLSGPAKTSNTVTVTIGGTTVTPSFAGLTATGEYQFNVTVPASAANGDAAVVATVSGASSPAATTYITVQK